MSNNLPDPREAALALARQTELDAQRALLDGQALFQTGNSASAQSRPFQETATTRLLTECDVEAAVDLFRRSKGWEAYAEDFRVDARRFLSDSPSAVYGVFEDRPTPDGGVRNVLVGVGVLIREHWDFAYWAVTWVMIDPEMRGKGYGERVMNAMMDHAKEHQATTTNPNCRVLLSAVGEAAIGFYERLGFSKLLNGPIPNGECLMYRDVTGPGLPLLD